MRFPLNFFFIYLMESSGQKLSNAILFKMIFRLIRSIFPASHLNLLLYWIGFHLMGRAGKYSM